MTDAPAEPTPADAFIRRWEDSSAAERANYAMFLAELCDLLQVERPEPTRQDDADNAYVFERAVTFQNGDGTTNAGRIDLYRRGCFVLEAKQGSEQARPDGTLALPKKARRKGTAIRGTAGWDDAMLAARGQAELYVRALPASEPNPPLLIVVDVGHTFELFADFSRQGRVYTPFPDARTHRFKLRDLADAGIRERLRLAWTDPLSLDPSRRSAKVTREVAARLAKLALSFEKSGHPPEAVAQFLMRCLFTFFAEDAGLLPAEGFTKVLQSLRDRGETALFPEMTRSLWETMKTGGFSPILRAQLLRFNGGLFEDAEALPVTVDQLALLIDAGEKQWRDVEPAIFGTLLERALDPIERHKLGAHYTPRAYVERLVMPTIIEPLREEWGAVQAAAVTLANEGKLAEARDEVRGFLRKLCDTTVLDPACGTGNFLYVTLEHMKRLEGEVWDRLKGLGEGQAAFEGFGLTVDPHQLRGIEINPRAAAIADLVLWIGYLQWHFRTFGDRMPAEPVIHAYHNIECRDAALEYDRIEPALDERGTPLTRWDGRSMKIHPATGEHVPDETARVFVQRHVNPRAATWPAANFIVGNPPYVGNKRMRPVLGDGYVEALRAAFPEVGGAADLVMYWWDIAAGMAESGQTERFGFITTNSITQPFNRRIIASRLGSKAGLRIAFAIPDHPWVDTEEGAAVRVAMTVADRGDSPGRLGTIVEEGEAEYGERRVSAEFVDATIYPDLSAGVNLGSAVPLRANLGMAFTGMYPLGQGFVLSPEEVAGAVGGSVDELAFVKPFFIARDLTQASRNARVIDFYPLGQEAVRQQAPHLYQWVLDRVKPQRDQDNREARRLRWWLFAETVPALRSALVGLSRYILVPRTAKHFTFQFQPAESIPDTSVVAVASDDALHLGILSSRAHLVWAITVGGRLGIGNDTRYQHSSTFNPFPFPDPGVEAEARIRSLGEALDSHRKKQQSEHAALTFTAMYNVLTKLRTGEPLTDKDKAVHEQGLVSVLKAIHDDLDAAVFDAYGWPRDLADSEILGRLVDLNRERAAEESRGVVRWLRPEYQNPEGHRASTQSRLAIADDGPDPDDDATPAKKAPWPKSMAEQAKALGTALAAHPGGLTPQQLARTFHRAQVARIAELLDTLATLGQARALPDGRYVRA